jgi:penicillin-binding protein 1A
MRVALEGRPDTGWTAPDSVVSMRVNEKTGEAAAPGDPDGRNEYFIAGTEPSSSDGAVPSGRDLQGTGSRVNDDLF